MYANLPSAEATTSCGSGPEGMLLITVRLTGSTMESVVSLLESTSSAFDGVPPPARSTAEARRVPRTSAEWTLIFMIVHYTLSSASEASPRTARHGGAIGRRSGPVGARWRRRGGGTAGAGELPGAGVR